jgi:hypothetical protein
MRQIGQAAHTFADANDGRGPGGGTHTTVNSGYPSKSSHAWQNILDAEVLMQAGKYTIARTGATANFQTLTCPNFKPVPPLPTKSVTQRQWAMNSNLTGGGIPDDPARHIAGLDFFKKNPVTGLPPQVLRYGDGGVYHLGEKMNRFGPTQILMDEHEDSDDNVRGSGAGPAGPFNRDAATPIASLPGWATNGGDIGFRHPYYGRANFLRFDLAVECLRPTDDCYGSARYEPPR